MPTQRLAPYTAPETPRLALGHDPDDERHDTLYACIGATRWPIATVRWGVDQSWIVDAVWRVVAELRRMPDGALAVRVVQWEEGSLYAPTRAEAPQLFRSEDGGQTWQSDRAMTDEAFGLGLPCDLLDRAL